MGRKVKKACVYCLTNRNNDRKYVGETSNFKDRMSYYKSTAQRIDAETTMSLRPIDNVIYELGFDSFDVDILDCSKEIEDIETRKARESFYIAELKSYIPKYGYNIMTPEVKKYLNAANKSHTKLHNADATKLLKSNPIIAYEIETGSRMIWLSSKSFAKNLGCDRAQVARSLKNGKAIHGYYVFPLDPATRDAYAYAIMRNKMSSKSKNHVSQRTLVVYREAYKASCKFAKRWGVE